MYYTSNQSIFCQVKKVEKERLREAWKSTLHAIQELWHECQIKHVNSSLSVHG